MFSSALSSGTLSLDETCIRHPTPVGTGVSSMKLQLLLYWMSFVHMERLDFRLFEKAFVLL